MTNTFHCVICDKDVEIKEVNHLTDHDERFLSCGHTSKLYKKEISEDLHFAENVSYNIIRDPQLANSKQIKIEAKNVGEGIPATVSGDHGIRKEILLSPNISLIKQGDTFTVNGPIIAYNINISANESSTTTIIDITSIIEKVSSSSNSEVEKEKVKDLLIQLNTELPSKPIPNILENLKAKFKEYFPLASPYIQQVIASYLQGIH